MSIDYLYVHIVWATKQRVSLLTEENTPIICNIISQIAEDKEIQLLAINGYKDHLHILVQLSRLQSISKVCQQLKGASSFIYNKQVDAHNKIMWQKGYFSESLHPQRIKGLINYINKQEEIHKEREYQFIDFI